MTVAVDEYQFSHYGISLQVKSCYALYAILDPVLLQYPPYGNTSSLIARTVIPEYADEYTLAFAGEISAEHYETMPWVVSLSPQLPLLEILDAHQLLSCGIFVQSELDIAAFTSAFTKLTVIKNAQGKNLWFRSYDPRILCTFMDGMMRADFFSCLRAPNVYCYNELSGSFEHFSSEYDMQAYDASRLVFSDAECDRYSDAYDWRVAYHLTARIAEQPYSPIRYPTLFAEVQATLAEAIALGFTDEEDATEYVQIASVANWDIAKSCPTDDGHASWERIELLAEKYGVLLKENDNA